MTTPLFLVTVGLHTGTTWLGFRKDNGFCLFKKKNIKTFVFPANCSNKNTEWFHAYKCWSADSNSGLLAKANIWILPWTLNPEQWSLVKKSLCHASKCWNDVLNSGNIQWFHAQLLKCHLQGWFPVENMQWFHALKFWHKILNSGLSLKKSSGFTPPNGNMASWTVKISSGFTLMYCMLKRHLQQWSLIQNIQWLHAYNIETLSQQLVPL